MSILEAELTHEVLMDDFMMFLVLQIRSKFFIAAVSEGSGLPEDVILDLCAVVVGLNDLHFSVFVLFSKDFDLLVVLNEPYMLNLLLFKEARLDIIDYLEGLFTVGAYLLIMIRL